MPIREGVIFVGNELARIFDVMHTGSVASDERAILSYQHFLKWQNIGNGCS